jgi:hypothetical protein
MGNFAGAIDSRSASSSQFILRVVDYALKKFGDLNGLLLKDSTSKSITGFDGATKSLITIGQELEQGRKIIFLFLDQFENIFFQPETLKRITDLLLKVCDA